LNIFYSETSSNQEIVKVTASGRLIAFAILHMEGLLLKHEPTLEILIYLLVQKSASIFTNAHT
jgi:hypothetical protein